MARSTPVSTVPETGFNANAGVWQLAVREDGRILVMVDRTYNTNPTYNDVPVADIFRIHADGSIDDSFVQVDTDLQPKGMLLLRSGKIVVYGNFNTVNSEAVSRLARLNANGTIDSTFALGNAPDDQVISVDEASDGKLVLGGWFQNIGGFNRRNVALLNADGSMDEVFDTSQESGNYPSGFVESVSALLNGDILITGNFLGWGNSGNTYPYRIATVNRQGEKSGFTNDSHWGFNTNPGANKIFDGPGYAYIAGMSYNYHNQNVGGLFRLHLEAMDLVFLEQPYDQYVEAGQTATFTADVLGTTTVGYQWYKDSVAVPGANSATLEIANAQESDIGIYTLEVVNASGSIVSAPVLLYILAEPEVVNNPLGKVANSGSTVTLIAEGIGAAPLTLQWYHDGVAMDGETDETLLIEGVLAEDAGLYHAVYTNNLGSVSTSKVAVSVQYGAAGVDPDFNPGFYGSPFFSLVGKTPDNGYRVSGSFGSNNGLSTDYAGISDTGTPISGLSLTGWTFGAGGVQRGDFAPDGSLIGMNNTNIFRILPNGSVDTGFDTSGVTFPSFNAPVLQVFDDGSILIGDLNFLTRLNSDGSVDATFNDGGSGPVGSVTGFDVSNSGKIFIFGTFTSYNGVDAPGLLLLNEDGSVDDTFSAGTGIAGSEYTSPINFVRFDSAGNIYVGGNFTSYNGTAVNNLVRIDSTGVLDATFVAGALNNTLSFLSDLMELPDGTLLVRGSFNAYAGATQTNLVSLDTTGARIGGVAGTGLSGPVADWQLEPDGSIVMVGSFFTPKNRMMVINPVPPAFEIVAEPEAFTIDSGQYGRLEVAAVGQGPFTFQWKKNGEVIVGETNFFIEFDPAKFADRGSYTVEVTGGGTTLTSDTVSPTIEGTEPSAFDIWIEARGVPLEFRATTDDPDGDGIPNAAEYAFGTDPQVANQTGAPEPEFLSGTELGLGNNEIYLTITIRVKRDVPGVTVTPRASVDLRALNAGAANVVLLSGPQADGDFDIYQYRSAFSVNAGSPRGFMDVQVLTF